MASKSSLHVGEEVSLQDLNTLRVPSIARWFCHVESEVDIEAAISFVKNRQCPVLILGGGSNLVLPTYFDGLVIHMALKGRQILEETETSVSVALAAGENWHQSVLWSVRQGYSGIENLALIPGTVGAAPIQNIGAYGVELDSIFENLEGMDLNSGQRCRMMKADCRFAYRDSIFKNAYRDRILITKVVLRLHKRPQLVLDYPVLAEFLADKDIRSLGPQQVADAVIAIRRRKLPDPAEIPNAGSFFKNPIVSAQTHQRLLDAEPDLVSYPQPDGQFKLAAGWLLDRAGWKGLDINGIAMHDKQALILTNRKRQSGKALLQFADKICANIRQRFGVQLEIEPRVFDQC